MRKMTGLLHLPQLGLVWIPLMMLPLLLGDLLIWSRTRDMHGGEGAALLIATVATAWYLCGGAIATRHATRAWRARRIFRRYRIRLERSDRPSWATDWRQIITFENDAARAAFGENLGRPIADVLGSVAADAEQLVDRLSARAGGFSHASVNLPDQRTLSQSAEADGALRLWEIDNGKSAPPTGMAALSFQHIPVAMLRLTNEGYIVRANAAAAAFLGGIEEGAHLSSLVDGLGRPITDWVREVSDGRSEGAPEVLRLHGGAAERFIQVSISRVEGTGGLIAVLSDAKAMKTLEAQFVQSQKMQAIGQLAGGIAHDFNNLLTAISGHCDLLMLRHDKGDPDYSDLDQIHQNANRAANLVGQLLAFSRKQTLNPETIDLRDTLSELTHLLNRLVGEKIRLNFVHDPKLWTVRADKSKVEQVIMNLVVNSRDAMRSGGEITVETANIALTTPELHGRVSLPRGQYVRVSVRDCGHGIPQDKIGKIFEPFFSTKKTGEGTGLGLSTAYGIVKQTGGYIFCESEPDVGTTFDIYLPAHPDDRPKQAVKPVQQVAIPTGVNNATVLLVEDEAPVRAFASRALKLRGYEVVEAGTAEEALELLQDAALKIDIFVTDVVMPGMDGPTWVRRALQDRPGTAVIFISGYSEDIFNEGRTPVPNAGFLSKPFTLVQLTQAVDRHLADLTQPAEG